MPETDELTPKQRRFVEEYCVDWNGARAAIRAGYAEKSARVTASKLLTKANIRAAVSKEQDRLTERTRITRERIMKELARTGFADMRNFAAWGGEGVALKGSDELSPDDSPAVREVSARRDLRYDEDGEVVGEQVNVSMKLHDKKGALELMGKHLGMWTDKLELGGGDAPVVIRIGGKPVDGGEAANGGDTTA